MLYLALARLPFSFRTVNLKYGAQKEADYLAVNRYGQVPALRHRGLTIVQSNVILDYLARTTGHFAGRTEQEQWTAREWLSWEADNITNVAKVRHYSRFRQVDPAVMDYFRPLAEAAVGFVDAALAGREWLVGDAPTIADIGCWGRMVFMAEGGLDIARWPNVQAWSRTAGGDARLRFALRPDSEEGPGGRADVKAWRPARCRPHSAESARRCEAQFAGRLDTLCKSEALANDPLLSVLRKREPRLVPASRG